MLCKYFQIFIYWISSQKFGMDTGYARGERVIESERERGREREREKKKDWS